MTFILLKLASERSTLPVFFFLIHLVKCVFVLKFSSFYYLCYFSGTTVKKVCLLDINNFLQQLKQDFYLPGFLASFLPWKESKFSDLPVHCIKLLSCVPEKTPHGLKNLL